MFVHFTGFPSYPLAIGGVDHLNFWYIGFAVLYRFLQNLIWVVLYFYYVAYQDAFWALAKTETRNIWFRCSHPNSVMRNNSLGMRDLLYVLIQHLKKHIFIHDSDRFWLA
jgi:hypothetical protein